jgi:hypothetical protein
MLTIDEIFSVFKELLPLFTAGGFAVSAAGLVPRIGPGRAHFVLVSLSSRIPSLFASLKSSCSEA